VDPLWAELINSDWHDYRGSGAHEDRIDNDHWLRRFLARCEWSAARLPNSAERESLRQLRHLLGGIVDVVRTGRSPAAADVATLNRILATAPLVRRLTHDAAGNQVVLEPVAAGIDRVLGEIVASFVTMLAEGDPTRIKICANPDCRWVIYDSSRNRSRRWCDKTECGNLIKVRRYRRRQRDQAT
jgi:predicted RNA-binding Zn ribbon-like protein